MLFLLVLPFGYKHKPAIHFVPLINSSADGITQPWRCRAGGPWQPVLYQKAFGLADLEHNTPNTVETIFECGSVSKQFTAFAALLLAQEGKIALSDPVHKYIPELPDHGKPITIQQLINHTSGLKDWGSIGELAGWYAPPKCTPLSWLCRY